MADVHLMPVVGTHTTIEGESYVITRVEFEDGTMWDHPNRMPIPAMGSSYKVIAHREGTRRAWRAEHPSLAVGDLLVCHKCEGSGFLNETNDHVIQTLVCEVCQGAGTVEIRDIA